MDQTPALQTSLDLWNQIQNHPKFKALSPTMQTNLRGYYFQNKISPSFEYQTMARSDPHMAMQVGKSFFAPDFEAMQKADQLSKETEGPSSLGEWLTTPLTRTISRNVGVPTASDISDEHPILRGVASVAEGQTSPLNAALWLGTAGLGKGLQLAGATPRIARGVQAGVSTYFAGDMAHGTYQSAKQALEFHNAAKVAEQSGDAAGAKHYYAMRDQLLTESGISGVLTGMVGKHAFGEAKSTVLDRPMPEEMKAMQKAGFNTENLGVNDAAKAMQYGSPYAPATGEKVRTGRVKPNVVSRPKPQPAASPIPGSPEYDDLAAKLKATEDELAQTGPIPQAAPQTTPTEAPKPVAQPPAEVLPKPITSEPVAKNTEPATTASSQQPIPSTIPEPTPVQTPQVTLGNVDVIPPKPVQSPLDAAKEDVLRTVQAKGDVKSVVDRYVQQGVFNEDLGKAILNTFAPKNSPVAPTEGLGTNGRVVTEQTARARENKQKAPTKADNYLQNYFRAAAAEKELTNRRVRAKDKTQFDQSIANSRAEQDSLLRNWAQFATPEEVSHFLGNMEKGTLDKYTQYRDLTRHVASDLDVATLRKELRDRRTTKDRKEQIHRQLGDKEITRFRVFNKSVKDPELLKQIADTQSNLEEQLKNPQLDPTERAKMESLLYYREAEQDSRGFLTGKHRIIGKKNVAAVRTWEPTNENQPTLDLKTVNELFGTKGKSRLGSLSDADRAWYEDQKAKGNAGAARQQLVRKRLMEKAGQLREEIQRERSISKAVRTAKGVPDNEFSSKLNEFLRKKPEAPVTPKAALNEAPTETEATTSPSAPPPAATPETPKQPNAPSGKEEIGPGHPVFEALKAKLAEAQELLKEPEAPKAAAPVEAPKPQPEAPKSTEPKAPAYTSKEIPSPSRVTQKMRDRATNWLLKVGGIDADVLGRKMGFYTADANALIDEWKAKGIIDRNGRLVGKGAATAAIETDPYAQSLGVRMQDASPRLQDEVRNVLSVAEKGLTDLQGYRSVANMRTKLRVKEQGVRAGDPVRIHPPSSDATVRTLAIRTPDGEVQAEYDGSGETAMNSRTGAGGDLVLKDGHTAYVIDHGPDGARVSIYRAEKALPAEPRVMAPEARTAAPKGKSGPPTIKAPEPLKTEQPRAQMTPEGLQQLIAAHPEVNFEKDWTASELKAALSGEPAKPTLQPITAADRRADATKREQAKARLEKREAEFMISGLKERVPVGALEAINAKLNELALPAQYRLQLRDKAVARYNTMVKGGDPLALRKVLDVLDQSKSKGLPALKFRSKLEEASQDPKLPNAAPGNQMLMSLVNKGVSPEEIKWTGLDDFLRDKPKVSKQDVQKYLTENRIGIEEITKKGRPEANPEVDRIQNELSRNRVRTDQIERRIYKLTGQNVRAFWEEPEKYLSFINDKAVWKPELKSLHEEYKRLDNEATNLQGALETHADRWDRATQYDQYTMPGGDNYREVLLQLPVKGAPTLPAMERRMGPQPDDSPEVKASFYGNHWDEPNVLAHVRLKDRTTPDGKKVLFVEEVQSDWHQAGREHGYSGNPGATDKAREEWLNADTTSADIAKRLRNKISDTVPDKVLGYAEEHARTNLRGQAAGVFPSDISRAAEFIRGWDMYSVDNRSQSTGKYYTPEIAALHQELISARETARASEDAYNKLQYAPPDAPFKSSWHELALRRILQMAVEGGYDKVAWAPGEEQARRYPGHRGDAHGFLYDNIIPSYLNKFGKKFGAKVGTDQVLTKEGQFEGSPLDITLNRLQAQGVPDLEDARRAITSGRQYESVPSLDITPEMRNASQVKQPYFWGAAGNAFAKLPATLAKAVQVLPEPIQKALLMSPESASKVLAGHIDPLMRNAMLDMGVDLMPGTLHDMGGEQAGRYFHGQDLVQVRAQGKIERFVNSLFGQLTMNDANAHEVGHHIWSQLETKPSAKLLAKLYPDAVEDINSRYGGQAEAEEHFAHSFMHYYNGKPGDTALMRTILDKLPEGMRETALGLEGKGATFEPDGTPYRIADLAYRSAIGLPFAGLPVGNPIVRLGKMLRSTPEGEQAQGIVRERTGELRREKAQLYHDLDTWIKRYDSYSPQQFSDFMDAVDGKPGATPLSGMDAQIARSVQDMIEERRDYIHQLNPNMFQHFLENYWPHVFEGNTGFDAIRKILGTKGPLKGPAGFAKGRYYDYTTDAMSNGAKPVTYNPVKMALLRMHEMDRYIMAHEIKADMRNAGLVKFYKGMFRPRNMPTDWQAIDDPIFIGKRPVAGGGVVPTGRFWAPREVARVLNNYLSPGLRGNPAFDIARSYGNTLNQAQLGLSWFHLTFEGVNAMMSDFALGMQKLTRPGQRVDGLALMGRSFIPFASGLRAYQLGTLLRREYLEPGSNPRLTDLANALTQAGGALHQDPFYRNAGIEQFKRAWTDKSYATAAWRAPKALIEAMSYPVMDHIVPRMKAGTFAQMAESTLKDLNNRGVTDHAEISNALDKVWDSVDNRMGQLVYDNLFWHKSAKDLAMLGIRSVGWNIGTFRELGGGIKDIGKLRNGELTSRLAYTVAMPIVAGTIGAVANVLMTGQSPQNLHDYFFPRTGQIDAGGKPARVSFPSYMKDVYGLAHDPGGTFVNKLHPMFQQMYDLWNNKDYYNVEIAHPGDPLAQRMFERGKYLAGTYKPLFLSNYQERARSGESGFETGVQSFVGINPAPKWIGQSDAEQLAYQLAIKHMEAGPRTTDSFQHQQLFDKVRAQYASGKMNTQDVRKLIMSGQLKPSDLATLIDEIRMSPLERHYSRLGIEDALSVWSRANRDEKALLRPMLVDKSEEIFNLPLNKQQEIAKQWREALH